MSKTPQYPIWPPFLPKNVCDTLSNNITLHYLVSLIQKIHDHTLGLMIQPFPEFWNISSVTNCVALLFGRGVCNAVVLYGINTPSSSLFTLTAHHLNDSLGIRSKVTMTGISLSPSKLTLTKIPLINDWHPSLMKWFGTWWSFSTCNRHSCWMYLQQSWYN